MNASLTAVDLSDVQGFVRFGYGKLTEACYLLLRVADAAAARRWLRDAPVTNGVVRDPVPTTAVNVAFTADGLRVLGVPESVVASFSAEFLGGMASDASRSRRLGDVGANAPAQWRWGAAGSVPHVVAMLFARPGGLDALKQQCTAAWGPAFEIASCLDTSDLHGVEQFGFTDGISQPALDWDRRRDVKGDKTAYDNTVALGEFLLGYPNEYGKYTERPLVDADADGACGELAPADDVASKRDVGRNGTYVVMRHLQQDVRGFWRFLAAQSGGDADAADALGAAFVGRKRDGTPLIAAADGNTFTYDDDRNGVRCPVGAHIRRANPRNADLPSPPASAVAHLVQLLGLSAHRFGDDLTSSVRFHRILRRGREFGPALSPEEARQPAPADGAERGLHFLCVNANIARQFEFLQNAWIMGTKFDGLSDESDPLLGNREPIPGCALTGAFTLPRDGALRRRVEGVPQFITVRGGAYLFMPSLRALRYIARVGAPTEERSI